MWLFAGGEQQFACGRGGRLKRKQEVSKQVIQGKPVLRMALELVFILTPVTEYQLGKMQLAMNALIILTEIRYEQPVVAILPAGETGNSVIPTAVNIHMFSKRVICDSKLPSVTTREELFRKGCEIIHTKYF